MKALLLLFAIICLAEDNASAQEKTAPPTNPPADNSQATLAQNSQDASQAEPTETLETTIDASEADERPKRSLVRWNQYKGPYFTLRFGAGFLVDVAGFAQDENSKRQIEMHPDERLRDFRFILGGKLFPNIERSITWNVGVMYDGPNHQWLIRQTGVMVAVPELWGHFFIGCTKEGFSLNKVMVGYDGWTMERATINDASIPILADGIKWLGYLPKHKFIWNVGYFNDIFSKGQLFDIFKSGSRRLVFLPILSEKKTRCSTLVSISLWQACREQTSTQVTPRGISPRVLSIRVPSIGLDLHGGLRSLLPSQSLAVRK
jgi:phosphate-selective porin OprO/OprP